MLATLRLIFQENWLWRRQVANLALMDIRKTCRGAVLGWAWLFVKPLMYIAVFWFALELGLRAGGNTEYPYIVWLSAGLIPWFFMQDMLNTGSNVYRRYPFLVNRIPFPLSAISTFYALSQFIVFLMLMVILFVLCAVLGALPDIHVLQLIPVCLVMLVFWICFSILCSPLSALSKDFSNLLKAFSTPLFWLSGIIFDVSSLPVPALHMALSFNPVTFFAEAVRASVCENYWLWERPDVLLPFLAVFVVTAVLAVACYGKLRKDVADVL